MSNKMQVAPSEVDRVSAPVCGRKLPPLPWSKWFDVKLYTMLWHRHAHRGITERAELTRDKGPRGQGATGPEP